MKIKDPIEFVGGKEKSEQLVASMEKYIKSSPPLKTAGFLMVELKDLSTHTKAHIQ